MNKRAIRILLCSTGVVVFILVCWVLIHQIILATRISSTLGSAAYLPAKFAIPQPDVIAPQEATTGKREFTHSSHKGRVVAPILEIGPFDLHRKYRSMEGPEVISSFAIDKLLASKRIAIPASNVHFLESDQVYTREDLSGKPGKFPTFTRSVQPIHSFDTKLSPLELYWFKGLKIEVLDENGKVMVTPEFLCHVNVLADLKQHYSFFPCITHSMCKRIVVLSQGLTQVMLPPQFGVPFASKESLTISLQAINKTTENHRRIKLRLTFYFIKDQDLSTPISALNWGIADFFVLAKNSGGTTIKPECGTKCCTNSSEAEDAPNNWLHRFHEVVKNSAGQTLTWHWIVPPGVHTYYAPVSEQHCPNLAQQGPIKAAWVHVHPFCRSVSLIEYLGHQRKALFTARSQTVTKPKLEIRHIDFLNFPKGIALNKTARYSLESVYNNTSGQPQDAMVIVGMFFSDVQFRRPVWATSNP